MERTRSISDLWNLLKNKQIKYLNIRGLKGGFEYFNAGTRFDLYLLKNTHNTQKTIIIDEFDIKYNLDLKELPFLPNCKIDDINKILTTVDKGIDVTACRSNYGTDKSNVKQTKTNVFKFPIVHNINKEGVGLRFSNNNDNGHFGEKRYYLVLMLFNMIILNK